MGWGDEIMATAEARTLQLADARKVAIRDRNGSARWSPIWDLNPRLATPYDVRAGVTVQWLDNWPGNRPYLDYSIPSRTQFFFTGYRVAPGEIYLSQDELAWGARRLVPGSIVIEPNLKHNAPINKDWGFHNWVSLVRLLARDYPIVQIGTDDRMIENVRFIETYSVRSAAAIVAAARAVIVPEGGLHHAAAALGVPAVVIFGGYISPKTTGYASHTNLFTGGAACGMRIRCEHCRKAMDAITPEQVAEALRTACR